MAIRKILHDDDETLRKISKPVQEITPAIHTLLDDMLETMYRADGVGLAAPQVGVLKRIVVIDIGEGPLEFINPEIISENGTQCDIEGCLSIPGKVGNVTRPNEVSVKALNRAGEEFIITGTELLARAFCHEIDHLNGILFTDLIEESESE